MNMNLSVRNVMAYFFALYLIASGRVAKAIKKSTDGEIILSVYFHNPSRKEFQSIVKWFIKKGFHFVSLQDLSRILLNESPFPKGAVVITVDDGWASNEKNIVEIANKYQVPVAIFISTEPVEQGVYWWTYVKEALKKGIKVPSINHLKHMANENRLQIVDSIKGQLSVEREAMTVTQVRRISESPFITIGGHTHTHPILINCSEEAVRQELLVSNEKLARWVGKDIEYFAYPNGDFSQREIDILRELGYRLGFANNPQYISRDRQNNIFAIPRCGFLEGASFAENLCRVVGVWNPRRKAR